MKLWSKSLVARLVMAFTFLSMLTIALLGQATYRQAKQALARAVFDHLGLIASLKEDDLLRWAEAQRQDVALIASLEDLRELTEILLRYNSEDLEHREAYSQLADLLAASISAKPDWSEAFILAETGGKVLVSTDRTREGDYRLEDDYFLKGLQGVYLQGVYLSPITLRPTMTVAAPIYALSQVRLGVLAVHLNLDYLSQVQMERLGLGETGEAYLVDRLSTFVPESSIGGDQFPRGVHTMGIDAAVSGQDGQGLYQNYAGIPVVGVYRWIDELKLALLVEIQQSEAFASARTLAFSMALSALVISALTGGMAYLLAQQIARPLLAVRDATEKMAGGDLTVRAPVLGQDEIGELANAFNQMSEQVQTLYQSLRHSEEYFRSLIENATDLILVLNEDRTVRYASPSLQHLLGYRPEEWIGKPLLNFVGQDSQACLTALETVHDQDEISVQEGRIRHSDGSWRIFEAVVHNRLNDPVVRGIVINARDITERKKAEDALRQSELKYRLVVEHALQGMIVLQDDRVVLANPAVCKILGRTQEEVAAYDVSQLLSLVHPDDLPMVIRVREARLQGDWHQPTYQFRFQHKDGLWRWVEASDTLLASETGSYIMTALLDIQERKEAEGKIRRQIEQLRALHAIDVAISSSHDQNLILQLILDQTMNQLGVDAASVLLLDPHTMQLEPAATRGFRTGALRTRIRIDQGWAGLAVRERRLVSIPVFQGMENEFDRVAVPAQEGFVSYYAVPLIAKGQVQGVLEIFQRAPLMLEQDSQDFLETLAGQAAIALDNINLFNNLQRSHMELTLAYDATIEGWSRALDLRDHETEGHTLRVTETTLQLARALGVEDKDLIHIRWGALLHDIGKMAVPDSILFKTAPLTEEEWEIMRQHPRYAYEMLSPIEFLRQSLDIPYCHHEKWDGSGYPRGLRGEQIPLAARIFSVVDNWDALRSDRPYRKAWPDEAVRQYLWEKSGECFDPQIVKLFLSLLEGG